MVAYSFQRQLVEPILAGTKGGTIRAARKWRYGAGRHAEVGGHAFPGEELQLYTGMRTKHCRLIARKTCLAVEPIKLNFLYPGIFAFDGTVLTMPASLDRFARFDGFADFVEMSEFWLAVEMFEGWHIRWQPLPW